MTTKKAQTYKKNGIFPSFLLPYSVLPTKMTYGNLFIFVFWNPVAVGLRSINPICTINAINTINTINDIDTINAKQYMFVR